MTKIYGLPNDKTIMADVDEKHHTATVSVYELDDLVKLINNEQEPKITAETVQGILDYLKENGAIWNDIKWADKNGKGFETDQGYFIQGLQGFRDYLIESEV